MPSSVEFLVEKSVVSMGPVGGVLTTTNIFPFDVSLKSVSRSDFDFEDRELEGNSALVSVSIEAEAAEASLLDLSNSENSAPPRSLLVVSMIFSISEPPRGGHTEVLALAKSNSTVMREPLLRVIEPA